MADEEIIEGIPEESSEIEEAIQDRGDIFDEYFNNEEIIEGIPEEVEPLIIETKGKWQPFEVLAKTEFEVGKTYKLDFAGVCEVAISKDKPTIGIKTNEITYTKDDTNRLWIKTGE